MMLNKNGYSNYTMLDVIVMSVWYYYYTHNIVPSSQKQNKSDDITIHVMFTNIISFNMLVYLVFILFFHILF